ncbi:MAG: sigma-54-dependent Fis family transcriptional regulator, partial [Acidobacteriota bacterium]
IQGESGTGKELAARALHEHSSRAASAFLGENCAAIPATLLESTLFGYVRGAFTGADTDQKGLFELADGGTLALDEIGDMSPELQAKLLRVLQEGEFRPIGSERTARVDVRVIGSTHQDLGQLVREGRFRQDLFFRLNGITIQLPPLRERKEDIPLLFQHFLERECVAHGRTTPGVEPIVLRALMAHDWPGNVRELENAVRRLLLFVEGESIGRREMEADPELARFLSSTSRSVSEPDSGPRSLAAEPADEPERIRAALAATHGHRGQAAALLGISRATLYRRLDKYGIEPRR